MSATEGLFPFLKFSSMSNHDKIYYVKLYSAIILGTLAGALPVPATWVGWFGGILLLIHEFLSPILAMKLYPLEQPQNTYKKVFLINAFPGLIIYIFFWVIAYDIRAYA